MKKNFNAFRQNNVVLSISDKINVQNLLKSLNYYLLLFIFVC